MSPERWRQVESLYDSALERDPESRARYLSEACNGDDELRRLVESLIEKGETPDSPLEKPVDGPLRFGPYSVVEKLGAGGMGEVYKAYDQRLNRTVAIKVLKAAFSDRFQREARAIAALNHPHICTLHDIGDGYLVMEYVEGAPLKGPLGLDQALEYTAQICDALDAAHRAGIVHRDLKPANILVTKRGIKLLDFGIARMMEGGDTLTVKGAVLGTPAYMAPEVQKGQPADARSDIYSLGCVLQEIITGSRAVPGKLEPPGLERVVRTCQAEDPEQRWQSAREMKLALELVRQPPVTHAATKRAWLVWAGVTVALVLAAAWAGFLMRRSEPGVPYRFTILPPEDSSLDVITISPDATMLAFSTLHPRRQLWLRRLDSLENLPLAGTEGAMSPFWSPDSRQIGFIVPSSLKTIEIATGRVQTIAEADFGGCSWSRDGVIFFIQDRVIHRVSASGGPSEPATRLNAAAGESGHMAPWFLPDGKHFLYSIAYTDMTDSTVHFGSLDAPEERNRLLTHDAGRVHYAGGPAEGHILFMSAGALMAQRFDPIRGKLRGEPIRVAGNVGFFSASAVGAIASRPEPSPPVAQLVWRDRSGRMLGAASDPGQLGPMSLSSDGERVAQTIVDAATGESDVWIRDLKRNNMLRLRTRGPDFHPVWSPDGKQLAFGLGGLWLRSPIYRRAWLGAEPELLGARGRPTDWSKNGDFLLLTTTGSQAAPDLIALKLEPGARPFTYLNTPGSESEGRFSPDASGPPRWVAYRLSEGRYAEVYVQAFSPGKPAFGPKLKISSDGGTHPRWRADGKELFYRRGRALMAVSIDADGGSFHSGTPVTLFEARPGTDFVVSNDGQRFLSSENVSDQLPPTPVTITLNWQAALK